MEPGATDLLGDDRVGRPQQLQSLSGDLTDDPHGQPGTGEWLAPDDILGQSQLLAHRPDLVLEQIPQRLDELEAHVVGETAHVVMGLDRGCTRRPRLDHIGVESPLHQETGVPDPGGGLLEDPDEGLSDDLALAFRLFDSRQQLQEPVLCLDMDEVDLEMGSKGVLDLLRLPRPQQPVVDEDASQLVADRLVHQGSGHRRVDSAGEPAYHPGIPDSAPDLLDLCLDDRV